MGLEEKKTLPRLIVALVTIVVAVLVTIFPFALGVAAEALFGFVVLLTGVSNVVFGVQLILYKRKTFIIYLLAGLMSITIAVLLFISLFVNIFGSATVLAIVLGAYCIILSVFGILDAVRE